MAINFPLGPIYPKTLTNAAWQKKKSFLDKAKKKTKTGLGDQLTRLEAAWRGIDWNVMGARTQGKWHSLEELQAGKKRAQRYVQEHVIGLYNVARATSRKARATAQIGGLSSTAKAAATAIANQTDDLGKRLMGITFEDFDEEEQRIRASWKRWRDALPQNVALLEKRLKALEKDPRNQAWDDLDLNFAFRSVGNALGNMPEFKDIWPHPWQEFDGLQNDRHPVLKHLKHEGDEPTPEEREAILELINDVKPHLAKLKKRLK
jgi:hypothetical protein